MTANHPTTKEKLRRIRPASKQAREITRQRISGLLQSFSTRLKSADKSNPED